MIKNNAFKRILIATLAFLILLIVYLFPNENKSDHSEIKYIESIKIPIYLLDENGYVARVNIIKNTSENEIKNIIKNLTINNEQSIYLPNGFKAIIPNNTKLLNFDLKDGLLKLNFSKEFLNIEAKNEERLIESIIFSLTELTSVDKIMLFIENERLIKLPNSNKYLPLELDRTFGINKTYDIKSLKDINIITTYYISQLNNYNYYVPVTSFENNDNEKIQIIIKNLKTSPIYQTNLISYLASSANLENYEILENAINLSFNTNLIANINDNNILEEVKYSIYLSLRDTYDIKSVLFEIPNQPISLIN